MTNQPGAPETPDPSANSASAGGPAGSAAEPTPGPNIDPKDRSAVEGAIAEVLRKHCGVTREIRSESRLAEDLGLDSVGLLTMAVEVENSFQTVLGEEPENPPRTVADVVALVQERLRERGS